MVGKVDKLCKGAYQPHINARYTQRPTHVGQVQLLGRIDASPPRCVLLTCNAAQRSTLIYAHPIPLSTLHGQVTEMGDRRSIKIPRKLAGGGAAAANGSTAAPTASEAAEALLPPPLLDSAGSEDTAGGSPAAFAPCGFGATMAASVDGGYPESVGTAIRGRGIRGGRVRRPSPAARMAAAAAAAEDAGAGGFGGGGGSGYGVQREQGCVQQWGAGVGSYPDDDEEGGVVVKVQRGVPGRGGVPRPMGIGGFATAAAELLQPEARDEVAASGGGVRRGAGGRAGSSRSRRNSGGDGVCYGGAAGYAEGTYGRALWEEGQGGGMEADAGGRVMGPSLGLGALSALAGRLLLPQLDEQQQQHSHIRADGGCTPTRVAAGEPQEVTGHLLPATAAAAAAANETPVSLQEQHVQDIGMGITGDSTMAEQAQPAHADGRLPPGVLVPPPPAPFPLTQNGSQLPPLPRPPGGSGRSALAPLSRTGSGNVPVPRPTTNAGVGAEGLLPILPLDLVAVTAGPAGPGAGAGNGAGGGGVGGAPTANGEGHVGGEEVSASGESNNENLEQLGSSGGQHSNVFHAPSPAAGPAALRRPASSSSSCGAILPRGMHTPSASNHGGGPPVAPRPPMAPRSGVVAAAAATAAAAASGHPGVSAVTGLRTQRRVSAGALLPYARPTVSGSSTVDDDGCGGSVGLPPRPAPGPALSAGYGGGGGRAVYRAAPLLPPRQAFGPVGGGEGPKRRCVSADHGGGGASYALSGDGGGDGGAEDGQEVTSPRRRRASGAGLAAILAGRGGGSSSGGGAAVDADRLAAHLSLLSPTQHIRRHPAGRELLLPPPAVPLGGAVPAAAVFAAAGPGAAQAAAAALRSPEPMEMDTPARSGGGDGEAGGGGSPESLVGASGGRQRCKSRKGKPQQAPLS